MKTQTARVGFSPSVSLPPIGLGRGNGGGDGLLQPEEIERYLLISNLDKLKDIKQKSTRRKRTKNNKRVSISSTIAHAGVVYEINNAPSYGVYLSVLHKIIEQLDICIQKWKRVFVLRFDLHQYWYTENNKMITKFRNNLTRRLQRAYEIFEVGYAWCREQERAKQQHYHIALFLDGDKINHSAKVAVMVRECWEALKVGNSVHIPTNCYYNVVDESSKREAVYRLSYLAKQRGKGYREKQTKDYSTSRLTAPVSFDFATGEGGLK